MRLTSRGSFTPDLHEFDPASGVGVNLQDISNAWGVELVFEQVGFQGRGLLRFQAVVERPGWYSDGLAEAECFGEILGIGQRKFLTVKVADGRMRLHDDSRLVPVDTSHPAALDGVDQAILQLLRILTKILDIAILVLGEPIERIFCRLAVRDDRIMDFDAGDAEDHPGIVCHGELIVFKPLGRLTLVDEGCARP
jgi:hypothetical protein